MTTLTEVQQLINNTPAGGICTLPGGVVDLPDFTPLLVTKSITIRGNGTVFNLPVTGTPGDSFLKADSLPSGSYFEVSDLTINGPSTEGWSNTFDLSARSAISYQLYRTWGSRMVVRNVTTTGGYSYGVSRAGGGKLEIKDCNLSGWVGALAFFESHGGWGDLVMRDCELHAPANSKYSSIGMYVHPHLHVLMERVNGSGWGRYLLYLNGSPQSAGHHDLIEVTAHNCALIQAGSGSETTLVRCTETGTPKNGGSYFKGKVLSVGSRWAGTGMIGFLTGNNVERRFVNDTFATASYVMAAAANVVGSITIIGCHFEFGPKTCAASLTASSNVALTIVSPTFTIATTTRWCANVENGSLRLVNIPSGFPAPRVVAPGQLLS